MAALVEALRYVEEERGRLNVEGLEGVHSEILNKFIFDHPIDLNGSSSTSKFCHSVLFGEMS